MAVDRQTIHCQPPNGGALVKDNWRCEPRPTYF